MTVRYAVLAVGAAVASVALAQPPGGTPGPMQSNMGASQTESPKAAAAPSSSGDAIDVNKLFATSCGWCHSKGGREAGKGPQLMGTPLTDGEIAYRIRKGKTGQMPAFEGSLTDEQIRAVVTYIRALKPQG